jgi:hypothetical protein
MMMMMMIIIMMVSGIGVWSYRKQVSCTSMDLSLSCGDSYLVYEIRYPEFRGLNRLHEGIVDSVMGGTCSTHGDDDIYVENFSVI